MVFTVIEDSKQIEDAQKKFEKIMITQSIKHGKRKFRTTKTSKTKEKKSKYII